MAHGQHADSKSDGAQTGARIGQEQGQRTNGRATGADRSRAIDEVLGVVKSGKEATVYSCADGDRLLAAKVYRSRECARLSQRRRYRAGKMRGAECAAGSRRREQIAPRAHADLRIVGQRRVCDAFDAASRRRRRAGAARADRVRDPHGVHRQRRRAGADAERRAPGGHRGAPVVRTADAQHRADARVRPRARRPLAVQRALPRRRGAACIDFPQAVDARFNQNALSLLERDIDRICAYFRRFGVDSDRWRLAHDLWARFLRSEL